MHICKDMNLTMLAGLMGRDDVPKYEAAELRDMLVRDFNGLNTDQIAVGVWGAYCCAVDPAQQTS